MTANLHDSYIAAQRAPAGLAERILLRLAFEKQAIALRRRIGLLCLAAIGSSGALIAAIALTGRAAAQSGLLQYLDLLLTDFGAMVSSWQDFALAVVDSLPAVELAGCLAAAALLLLSLRLIARDAALLRMASDIHP